MMQSIFTRRFNWFDIGALAFSLSVWMHFGPLAAAGSVVVLATLSHLGEESLKGKTP